MTENQIYKARARIQREAVLSIENNGGKGLLAIATGVGKSKIPIDYAKKKKNKIKTICLIVPTEKLRDEGWSEEFKKWDAEHMLGKTTKICYASAHKIEKQKFDLVILDECHNITPLSFQFFKNNTCKNIIALTATPPEDEYKKYLLSLLGLKITYQLSVDEAVKLGIVAPYKITIVYTKLNNLNKDVLAGSKERPFYQTEEANYTWYNDTINNMKDSGLSSTKKYQSLILRRMRIIYNLKSKTRAAKRLLDMMDPEDRVLVFCGSIEQAEKISPFSYHSKSGDKHLQDFKELKINELSCVKAINEGHNIPNVDKAIIVQLNSKEKDLVQRIGRVIRYRKGHEAHIYIIVCKDTQDEIWLSSSIANIDRSIIDFKYLDNED